MMSLDLGPGVSYVLCLGAHADDLEIGCGGTVMTLVGSGRPVTVTWVVWSAAGARAEEARDSAAALLRPVAKADIQIKGFRDGFFPHEGAALKEAFEELKATVSPDLILTHYRQDLHQDHRLISELTWNTFRDHLILEYEIPKYDGDLGTPNVFVPLSPDICQRKVEHLLASFPSQRGKRWFAPDLFRALLRLRGMECNAPGDHAEAFYGRKLVLG
ncbi:MAG: PIG-L family deacetylase [Candidatus Rokubacteria bacterium]|nr:PIG-L family deacetylase [Candidatus Rokubacteria bacterium]